MGTRAAAGRVIGSLTAAALVLLAATPAHAAAPEHSTSDGAAGAHADEEELVLDTVPYAVNADNCGSRVYETSLANVGTIDARTSFTLAASEDVTAIVLPLETRATSTSITLAVTLGAAEHIKVRGTRSTPTVVNGSGTRYSYGNVRFEFAEPVHVPAGVKTWVGVDLLAQGFGGSFGWCRSTAEYAGLGDTDYLYYSRDPSGSGIFTDDVPAAMQVVAAVCGSEALPSRPPTTSAASLEDRSATLAWEPPACDGGLPITGYRVSRNGVDDGGGGPWSTVVSAQTRSFTFTQLRLAVPYELSVQAINAVGTGPASTRTAQVGRLATAPANLTATSDAESRSATLTWEPPSDTGLPITGYRVARDGDDSGGTGPWSTAVPATARSQTFTYLLPGSTYTLSVQAITEAGLGAVNSWPTTLTPMRSAGYLPLEPKRVLDTRSGLGAPSPARIGPGGTLTLQVTGARGSGLAPFGSTAVALNVTAVGATADGYVSVYPTGAADGPASSNINTAPGQTIPNLVISKVATDGTVTLYNHAGTVDLVADVQGAFSPAAAWWDTSRYLPMDPQRLLDTRTGLGQGAAAKIAAGSSLRLQVTGAGRAPAGATAVVLNVTATNPTAVSYLSVFPTGSATGPSSSNLNVTPGETVPNLVVSKLAADGSVTIYNDSGTVDVIADLQGAFVPADVDSTSGHGYRPSTPRRVLDTRIGLGVGAAGAVGPQGTVTLKVTGAPGSGLAPVGSSAVVLNVTATGATAHGYVSVYPTGFAGGPRSSNLNVVPGRTSPNLVVSKVGPDGTITLYNHSGSTDLVADLQGAYSTDRSGTPAAGQSDDEAV